MRVPRPQRHDETVQRLWRAAAAARLPHALLFEGRAGVGKFQAAKWFALGLLCARGPGEPCGACSPCKRVLSGGEQGNHGDLFVLDPEDAFLASDFEKSLQIKLGRIAYRPQEQSLDNPEFCLERFLDLRGASRFRPVLIRESHRMNVAAQNALLKTLEEPRPGTVMVLDTHKSSTLLATILSRCIRIRFEALDQGECARVLVQRGFVESEARELARMAAGSPGLAETLARTSAREICSRLLATAAGERAALAVAGELWELEGEFSGNTENARARERVRTVVDLGLALLVDAQRLCQGMQADALAHGASVEALAHRLGARELRRRCEGLMEARADVEHNLLPAAVLERALLALAEGSVRKHVREH